MNITHAKTEEIKGCKLEAIFNRQRELMEKYHHIESKSGLCQTEDCPVNLDDKRGQARLKDFAWRATEEVAEAFEVLPVINNLASEYNQIVNPIYGECHKPGLSATAERKLYNRMDAICEEISSNTLHLKEELIDSLHFFTEMSILADMTPDKFEFNPDIIKEFNDDKLDYIIAVIQNEGLIEPDIRLAGIDFITNLGICCNFLKNKAWKQTQMVTDKESFKEQMKTTWLFMIRMLIAAGLDGNSIADLYLKKSQVNQFRQRTNY